MKQELVGASLRVGRALALGSARSRARRLKGCGRGVGQWVITLTTVQYRGNLCRECRESGAKLHWGGLTADRHAWTEAPTARYCQRMHVYSPQCYSPALGR